MRELIIGINGHVVAIDKQTGQEVWRTKLKSSTITVVSSDMHNVYAAASGHLFCLNRSTGEQLWKNELKGLGYGTCIIDSSSVSSVSNEAIVASSAATAAAMVAVSGTSSGGDGA